MTLVCYNKPNRSKPRYYTASDLERIAGYVADNGVPLWKIVASVMIGVGAGYLVCRAARSVRSLSTILSVVKEIALIGGAAKVINILIEWLKRGRVIRIPVVNRVALVAVLVLVLIHRLLQALENVGESIFFFNKITKNLDSACEFVRKRVNYLENKGKKIRKFPPLNAL